MNPHPLRDEPAPQANFPEKPKNDLNISNLPPISDETLMQILDFDDVELHSNRGGFVTKHQKQRLHDELKNDADSMWLMVMIMLGVAAVLGLIIVSQGIPMIALVIGVGIIVGAMLLAAYWQQSELRQDSINTKVRHVQGAAHVRWGNSRSNARLIVGDQSFPITMHQASALTEFDLRGLRAYYSQHGKRLLSAELLREYSIDKLKTDDLTDEEFETVSRSYEEADAQQGRR
jgi:hypothetical protein